MSQWLKNTAPTFRLELRKAGDLFDPGGGVTLTINRMSDPDNDVVTGAATTNTSVGIYDYTLSASETGTLDVFDLTWIFGSESVVTREEIVGGFLFTEAELRNHRAGLANVTSYPDAAIHAARTRVTDLFEQWTGRSFVPRYRRLKMRGNGRQALSMHRYTHTDGASGGEGTLDRPTTLIQATIDGSAVSDAELEGVTLWRDPGSVWTTPTKAANVIADIEYGYDPYGVVHDYALLQAADLLIATDISKRATQFSSEWGETISYNVIPGLGRRRMNKSSIPEINAWVESTRRRASIA